MVRDSYEVLTQCLKSEPELDVLIAITANVAAETRDDIPPCGRGLTSRVRALGRRQK